MYPKTYILIPEAKTSLWILLLRWILLLSEWVPVMCYWKQYSCYHLCYCLVLVSLKPTLQRQLIYNEQNNLHSKPIVETQNLWICYSTVTEEKEMRLQKNAYRVFTQFVLNTEQYMVNQIKENETVRARSINGADKK